MENVRLGSSRRIRDRSSPRRISRVSSGQFKKRCQGTRPMQYLGLVGMG